VGYLDTAVGSAKNQLRQVAGAVVNRTGHREQAQSVTISSDRETVQQLFQEPARLSQVLGDIAEVQHSGGDDEFRWVFTQGPLDGTSWDSRLVADSGRLRFVSASQDGGTELVLDFSEAPQSLGTEVTLRVKSAVPALLSGALAFKALYRARALLQTGEIPTIRKNPSARKSAR
jgi:uncharacterized membrane protein